MKKIYFLFLLSYGCGIYDAQSLPNIETKTPNSIPPSPTVAALMKFEEVPVSNYTGIPDVSIPIFSEPTIANQLKLDIALKYHPNNVAAKSVASDVGLGWSLFAGGTVSRTVRGLPDEIKILPGSYSPQSPLSTTGSIGIYHDNIGSNSNHYKYFKENILNSTLDYYKGNLTSTEKDIGNEFIWETSNMGKYDSEYDIWQFNFLNESGRFYIKKNPQNQLEIVPLEDYRVKIINQYDPVTYIPNGFIIFDDRGYQYVFDISETTINGSAVESVLLSTSQNLSSDKPFKSAFQLTKIIDNNNNLITSFDYNINSIKESTQNATYTANEYSDANISYDIERWNGFNEFVPFKRTVISLSVTDVKKLSQINVIGKARVYFDFSIGRYDTNLTNPSEARALSAITVKDWDNHVLKKYDFAYDYSNVLDNRMILKSIELLDKNNLKINDYKFYYDQNDTNGDFIGKDYWGYFNLIKSCLINKQGVRNVSPNFSTTDILTKIKLPTGGSTIFKFESNEYSYTGDQEETNFSENSDNLIPGNTQSYSFNNNNTSFLIPTSTNDRIAIFNPSITYPEDMSNATLNYSLQKNVNGITTSENLVCPYGSNNCCITLNLDKNTSYQMVRQNLDLNYTGTDNIVVNFYTISNQNKFLYGGGNRISKIGYFDTDVNQNYYKNFYGNPPPPQKEINYNYKLFSDVSKSSGSLIYPRPVFQYTDKLKLHTSMTAGMNGVPGLFINTNTYYYNIISSENILNITDTKGSAVGYSNVSVSETGKGITKYTYKSPIDFPEQNIMLFPPFVASANYDYKRGLIVKEEVFDNSGKTLRETNYNYSLINYIENTGHKFQLPRGQCFSGSYFYNYSNFVSTLAIAQNQGYIINNSSDASYFGDLCGIPLDPDSKHIMPYPIYQAYGWAKLDNKTSKEYLFTSGVAKTIETDEFFTYNSLNKNIATHKTVFKDGSSDQSDYFYHSGNSTFSQNRISEIEKIDIYKNNLLIGSKKINYRNDLPNNGSFLPGSILTYDIQNAPTTEVTYNQYDDKGNLLQYTTKAGIPTAIIWGYNQTQPIAKIDGATYAQVSSLATALITTSNLDASTGTEASDQTFRDALDTFRKTPALVNFQISTFSYDPLTVVKSVTPPSGIKELYKYDSANRLQSVVDVDGKILKEYTYHYK